ncbi:hypothetical protein [Planctomyces sp. SH-PL14]|uniref:hypothetical protein n=1 Tax=Planctomyces sp. SH-PL14 TaxID=1632864 RepID=UPI00078BEE93|nr:hypothetical protein [Planctomyces sp. SH-PL14]AMV21813.1 hypothetical protein VT03_28180 [Planctomyces sp. SH-PL14]
MADENRRQSEKRVFRLMLSEYQLLQELAHAPVDLDNAAPSVEEASEFLATLGLVVLRNRTVTLTDGGWNVVRTEPISRTAYTVAFDRCRLIW